MVLLQTTRRPTPCISWLLALSFSPLFIGCAVDAAHEQPDELPDSVLVTEIGLYADASFRMHSASNNICQGDVTVQVLDEFGERIGGVTVVGEFTGDLQTRRAEQADDRGLAVFASPPVEVGKALEFNVVAVSYKEGAGSAEFQPFDGILVAACAETPMQVEAQFGIATSPVDGDTTIQPEDCTCGIATSPRIPLCDDCSGG